MGCDLAMMPNIRLPSSFNSRSPNGLRQAGVALMSGRDEVSIHAAQMGCDLKYDHNENCKPVFQFTQPKWAATEAVFLYFALTSGFNSRSPNGLRLGAFLPLHHSKKFQFTQPIWAATFLVELRLKVL